MAILPIYTYNARVLREKTRDVTSLTDAISTLVVDMYDTMKQARGVGLAANQVGSGHSIVVIDLSDVEEYKDSRPLVMINPVIDDEWGDMITYEEGCLSVPQVRVEVERSELLHVRYMDQKFEPQEVEADGFLARVIQHEVDHLNGVFMTDHLRGLRKRLIMSSLKKIMVGEMETDYPIADLEVQQVLTGKSPRF